MNTNKEITKKLLRGQTCTKCDWYWTSNRCKHPDNSFNVKIKNPQTMTCLHYIRCDSLCWKSEVNSYSDLLSIKDPQQNEARCVGGHSIYIFDIEQRWIKVELS